MITKYQPVIGLEVHVELATKSKMFCSCSAEHFRAKPNENTCPVCLGLPGAMPYSNEQAIVDTILFGYAFNCTIQKFSKFDRKHYFYPDLPKAYQISQYDLPLCENGEYTHDGKNIRIKRIHLEEDTGKLVHAKVNEKNASLVDFNRSGVALMELVTEPDFNNIESAISFLREVQKVVRFIGISEADMEKGSMRLEANVSVRLEDSKSLPDYKIELKNINSFRFLKKALEIEIIRQSKLLSDGKKLSQETRGYDEKKSTTFLQRSKEEAKDYRYFPEPDLPPLRFADSKLKKIKETLSMLPSDYVNIFTKDFKIRDDYADLLTSTPILAKQSLQFFKNNIRKIKKPDDVAQLIINLKVDKVEAMQKLLKSYLAKKESIVSDESQLTSWVKEAINLMPQAVADYKNGKTNAIGVIIGKVMQMSNGKADPNKLKSIIEKEITG